MCDYCREKNEDIEDPFRNIDYEKHPFGLRGTLCSRILMIARDPSCGRSHWQMNFDVTVGDDLDDTLIDKYICINYCPFCGGKLDDAVRDSSDASV